MDISCLDGVGAFNHVLRFGFGKSCAGTQFSKTRFLACVCGTCVCGQAGTLTWSRAVASDPLTPKAFSLAIMPALDATHRELLEKDVAAYLDGVYLLTTPDRARTVLGILSRNIQYLCGISLNHSELHSWRRSGGAAPRMWPPSIDTPDNTVWRSAMAAEDFKKNK